MKTAGLYNCDCLEAMREYPDKYFDLAIVDPPYGSGGWNNGKNKRDLGVCLTNTKDQSEQVADILKNTERRSLIGM